MIAFAQGDEGLRLGPEPLGEIMILGTEFAGGGAAVGMDRRRGRGGEQHRDETDRGVLMICDPRLISKGYGRKILKSLPPMKLTRDLAAVQDFFRR
jgi:hypothetical protein